MKQKTYPLSDATVRAAKPRETDYKLSDGNGLPGLHLLIKATGAKLWRYKFHLHGREGLLSIGAYPAVTLAAAREAHRAACALVASGVNPVHARREDREHVIRAKKQAERGAFSTVLQDWRDATDKGLAASTIRQREREIAKYIEPEFKSKSITAITRTELADLLKRVEKNAPEVARNLRGYLMQIFEHAISDGVLAANPMPPVRPKRGAQSRRRSQVHHAAMDTDRIPGFLAALDASSANLETKAAMRLVLLTACRKNEAVGARWSEFNLDAGEWVLPAPRMKGRVEHWVPLPRQAVALLRELREISDGTFLFPHRDKPNTPMAGNTLNALMDRIGYGEAATPHGFRSVFSTHFNGLEENPDVIERCLAHVEKNDSRSPYNRYEYREQRQALMQKWADYLDGLVAAHNDTSAKK
ncbi:tyrosine-type recombinase/integrase [Burkholderia anthina]|uniref:tyrosine-type recombinase/integrase n=1 Tax=Burkholderia anthina TaxID=179879 RepID=UPI000757E7A7|nr:tyrosine-type recombinase/integrase [Burkholderia anthina]KWH65125.1 integrase [Burkholderia anthina]